MNRMCTKCNNIFQIPEGHENEDFCCPFCGSIVGPRGDGSSLVSASALPSGTELGGEYIIETTIGQGGFGITYKAHSTISGNKVAIKEYFPRGVVIRSNGTYVSLYSGAESAAYESGKSKFIDEARSLSSLNGFWGTAKIINYFEANGTAYIVMEYLEGRKLQDYMPDGHILNRKQFEATAYQMCDILDKVHSKGIIHRDISPDNILITSDGTFKLIDFGAAKLDYTGQQQSSQIVLKKGYAPIEQYSDNGAVGPYTDIYSLGVILYKAATGYLPMGVVERIVDDRVVPVYVLNSEIPLELSDIIMKAISIQGTDRFQSARELRIALMMVGKPAAPMLPPAESQTVVQGQTGIQVQSYTGVQSQPEVQGYSQSQSGIYNQTGIQAQSGVQAQQSGYIQSGVNPQNDGQFRPGIYIQAQGETYNQVTNQNAYAGTAANVYTGTDQNKGQNIVQHVGKNANQNIDQNAEKNTSQIYGQNNKTQDTDYEGITGVSGGTAVLPQEDSSRKKKKESKKKEPKKSKSYQENIRGGNWMILRVLIAVVLVVAAGILMIFGISKKAGQSSTEDSKIAANFVGDGKVLNIQCWNSEFPKRLAYHYPGYVMNDPNDVTAGGKIGDIEVRFYISASRENVYQNNLDIVLKGNDKKPEDERVDIFLIEADYALKYIDSNYALPIESLGIDVEKELSDQYSYTKDVATDLNGKLKGVSWQGCPGVLIYNREAAQKVFGSDNPNTVQTYVETWYEYEKTASIMHKSGYKMTASVNDTYRVFSNNVSAPWVVDGKIRIDDKLKSWVDMSKEQVEMGYTTTSELWSVDWSRGFSANSNVFCYFGPAWLINYSMGNVDNGKNEDDGSRCFKGGWAATTGPQGFFWGGTWICAANGTDNQKLVADIMRKLTTDVDIMSDIVRDENDFVNNMPAMKAAASDDSFAFKPLGGQNPIGMFVKGAEKIKLDNLSKYDQGCNESFQKAMKNYFEGRVTYDEAVEDFKKLVREKYPELY